MTKVTGTYSDRLRLVHDLKTTLPNNPEVQVLRDRLRRAPETGGPNVYVLPYNVLLSARGFLLQVPSAQHTYYRPLRAVRMQHDVPPVGQAEEQILRSIHAYIMDPKGMRPAGEPYTALQRAQMMGLASGAWHWLTTPFRALHARASAPPDRKLTRPWYEG